jgi:hypothetical protein
MSKSHQKAVVKAKRACVLRSVVVGTRRLILYPSYRQCLNLDPEPDDPDTITIADAIERSSLSRATIGRLLKAGDAEAA